MSGPSQNPIDPTDGDEDVPVYEPPENEIYGSGTQLAGVPHLSALVTAIVAVAIVGQPLGWIGFLLPAGPLITTAVARAIGRKPAPTWRLALGFSLICAVMIGGSWSLLRGANDFIPLRLTFPLLLLAFFLALLNFVLVSVSRSFRAWKSIPLEYPWIPGWLDRPLGLTPMIKEM